MHQLLAGTLDRVIGEIKEIQADAPRSNGLHRAPLVADDRLPHAQGLDGPEGSRRPEDARATGARTRCRWPTWTKPEHVQILETWMKSYRPEELFDETGRLMPELAELAPKGEKPHERQPARQRRPAAEGPQAARLPRLRRRGAQPRRRRRRGDAGHGQVPPRRDEAEPRQQATSASSARTRPTPTAGRTCSKSPTAPGWPRRCPTTTTSTRTAA